MNFLIPHLRVCCAALMAVAGSPAAAAHHEHAHAHNCIHSRLQADRSPTVRSPQEYRVPEKRARAAEEAAEEASERLQPLRIRIIDDHLYSDEGHTCFRSGQKVWVDGVESLCSYSQVLTPEKRDILVRQLLPKATAYFASLLRVRRVLGRLRLGSFSCGFSGGVAVPSRLRTSIACW